MVADEVAEDPADTVLLGLQDGGVRDRQAERSPKQGGDGKPVGEATDEGSLGGGAEVADPRGVRGRQRRRDEHRQGHDEQPQGDELHPAKGGAAFGFVERRRVHG